MKALAIICTVAAVVFGIIVTAAFITGATVSAKSYYDFPEAHAMVNQMTAIGFAASVWCLVSSAAAVFCWSESAQ